MGGRGSGGQRIGSGRKPKDAHLRSIQGGRSRLPGPGTVAAAPAPSIERFDPPAALFLMRGPEGSGPVPNLGALLIWEELAPEAFEAGTLTKRTVAAFAMLCRAVAIERGMEIPDADHRGLMQRIGTWMKDFGLAPLGKPIQMAPSVPGVNPLARFTGGAR